MVPPSDNEEDKGRQMYARKSDKKVTFRVNDYIENEEEEDSFAPVQKY